MVFESIVVDVLNRFLGDYVENLNHSQLKLGIWGGDAVLENLVLKQNALEELNIPVQTVYGHLGKLTLKIPWKNLYGASVEATVERLLLVVNPNAEVKYDPEKEDKIALASKQAELIRVEEAKKKENEEDKVDETFVEKLVTQIIKNVQLTIKDIHVRYEDSITNPDQPFSLGITLHNLSVHTTDENWKQAVISEAVTKIYKILSLEGLAIYWNPETELYAKSGPEKIKLRLQQEIATKQSQPSFYSYTLGPINATAKLKLNPKPEQDAPKFSIPKVTLSLHMEQLSVSLTKAQYRDMMLMFDSMDRMNRGAPYRRYRPDLKVYRGHYTEWWHFAYTCVLEQDVRRKRRNWDWTHMLAHRQLCKDYATAYQGKLTNKGKVANDQQKILDEAEKKLDLLNLVVIRQRIEMEVERLGKLEAEARKSRGWFSGWWTGASAQESQHSDQTDILKQFQNAMTPSEKEKLFRAIDYQENSAPLHLPAEYVAVKGEFRLDRLVLTLTDQTPVLFAAVEAVSLDLYQRPSANALRLDIQMHTFTVSGTKQDDFVPAMVVSKEVAHDVHLLNIMFETNPLDKSCDQRVKVSARPLQMVYDAQTVVRIVEVFKPPQESTALTTLQAAAENKLSDLKEKSALGMQYAVHQHTFIDLDVDVAASYIIIPHHGQYKADEHCVVMKLGAIRLKSSPRAAGGPLDVARLYKQGLDDDRVLKEIAKHSYDKITLALTQMQIVVAKKGEDWNKAIAADNEGTPLHLLEPTNLIIQIHKCLITDDPRMPKVKVRGELEKIAVSISQDRLLTLCEILVSMPLPQSEESAQLKSSESKASSLSLLTKYLDPAEKQRRETARLKKKKAPTGEPSVQLTEVEAFFIIKEAIMCVNRNHTDASEDYEKLLVFGLNSFELTVTQKTYNLEAMVRLGAVSLEHYRGAHQSVPIVETPGQSEDVQTEPVPKSKDGDEYLFTITYCNVDKKCPEFRSLYGSVEQLIELRFTKLRIHLHLQSLQEIMSLVNECQTRLQDISSTRDRIADSGPLETIVEDEELAATKSKTSVTKLSLKKQVESIQIKMMARLGTVEIEFSTELRPLSIVRLQGARAGLVVKASYTELELNIASLYVRDLNPYTIHKDILKVVGGDVVNIRVVLFNTEVFPASEVDISIEAQLNTLRIVYLNWFVCSMLDFLNNFQTAQQAIVDASAQAAEAAREKAAQAYQNSTKVMLKIRMSAPIILVPENSKSYRALIIDLGRLNINNRFINITVQESSRPVSVDELTLELEEMKVSCAVIGMDIRGEVLAERKLLRPTTFKLLVKRSLSSWHSALPDLDVSGRINSISITVGHSDYKSIMRILNQNLSENSEQAKPAPIAKSKSVTKTQVARPSVAKSTVAVLEQPQQKDDKAARTTIKFCFTMDSFVINLSNTDSNADEEYAKDVDFARLSLTLLSLKGRMFSDNSMHTTLLLVDCTMDDTRPKRGAKITRFLERRTRHAPGGVSPDKVRSMVDITYTLKNNDTFIDMRIFSFNLILAMDFLNKLAEFATSGLAADVPTPEPNVTTSDPNLAPPLELTAPEGAPEDVKAAGERTSVASRKKLSVVSSVEVGVQKQPPPPPKSSMMTVNIKIEQPDIILVESLEDRSCDAFVLNMEVRFKLRQTASHMVADGGISSLQVTARRLDELLHTPSGEMPAPLPPSDGGGEGAARYLLSPTHMSLAVSQPPNCGMHVDIAITDIKITISPDMIALMLRVLATMASTEDQDTNKENTTVFYDNLWEIRPFKHNFYWFLKTEEATEAIELNDTEPKSMTQIPVGEICLLSSPSIVVAFEMDIGRETIPVLVMQASLQGQLKDWSSDFHMESTWAMQVSYYNIARAEWEPLVEPVERMRDAVYKHEPWELHIEVIMRPGDQRAMIDTTDEAATNRAVAQQQANKTITVSSTEPLEITITRTGLEVLTMLSSSFSPAMDTNAVRSKSETIDPSKLPKNGGAPYVLHNSTGLTAKLVLAKNADFTVYLTEGQAAMDYREVVLEPGAHLPLRLTHPGFGQLKLNEPPPPLKLLVQIIEMNEELLIPVERADKRYFPLGRGSPAPGDEKGVPHVAMYEPRGLISDIVMQDAAVQIYLRSVLQVTNSLAVNVSVYYMTRSGNEVRLLGDVKPADTLRLPLQAVYTLTAEIFFSVEDFTVSVSPFIWRELQQEVRISKLLHCDSKDKNSGEKFYLKAVGKMEQVFFEHSNRSTFASCCYDVVLKPAVKMQNCLPVPITVSQLGLKRTQKFQPGEMFHLSHLAPNRASIVVMIENYLEKCWVCTKNLPEEDEITVWSFESHDSPSVMVLDLGMHNADQDGTQVLSLYCPFWMLNKTGFTLSYRKSKKSDKDSGTPNKNVDETGNVIFHPKDYKEPILFSFRAKNFFGKKKAAIRLEFGEWSDKFSLDVPGSSGVITCKLDGRTYQVSVENKLTFNSLTKMVIFTPFFLIINEAPFDIQYQELHRSGDPWQTVEKNSVSPLWPAIEKEEKLLLLRVAYSMEISAPFLYTEQHSTCLKLNNSYGGLHVEVAVSEDGTYITVRQYRPGHAPALLVNYTNHSLTVLEMENVNTRKLPPLHEMLYAWDNPAGPQKLIVEQQKKSEVEIEIRQDGIGALEVSGGKPLYWVSFLDGMQRVVLFSSDVILARGVHLVGDADVVETEMVLSMHGMGLSLVDDQRMQEIIYVSMSNSGIIWEQCKIGSRRYKRMDVARSAKFEEAYQKYIKLKMVSDDPVDPVRTIDDKTDVNFEEMRFTKGGARLVRRTMEPGLWASYGMSAHCVRLHARLHRLQVDQQLPLPTFPVVLAPVPPPRSVASEASGMKPFMEVSIVERVTEHSKVRQYKYFKVLVQEFHVKVDMGLITALLDIFPQNVLTEKEALEAFTTDMTQANQPLASLAASEVASDQKNFYDNLHLSPIKLHVSFSLGGATQLPSFVGTILQSIGVTLTDMNDVVFKLSYYERTFEFLSQKELVSQVQYHYMGQALKQMYVLVLGLDVIGNPYGLVIGLKTGVQDLFYEPFQGAIQGPGEFAEGLYLGMRSLVGHTVGGAAGAVSRITGAMGHGLAALSLDKDYQRRRRDNMNKPPANLQEGLARSGKGLVMGVVDGVTGVFTKPFEGARDEGVEGFFKGLGRGAVGLVARPTAGVVDFAAGSLDAVKRAADLSDEVTKMRAARYLPPETGVRPYSRLKAEGYKLLFEVEKGKFLSTDTYQAHVWVLPNKEVVMCTDKRILYLEKNAVFGGWQITWSYLWTELPEMPTLASKGVYIPTAKRKVFGMFSSSGSGKLIFLYDEQQRKYLLSQCERLKQAAG